MLATVLITVLVAYLDYGFGILQRCHSFANKIFQLRVFKGLPHLNTVEDLLWHERCHFAFSEKKI